MSGRFGEELAGVLRNNARWAAEVTAREADFFARTSRGQAPTIVWIGCSDSRVPAEQIMGVGPGEVFVHRNIANVVTPGDANCAAVLQYAVEVLRVAHVVVCGHYGCGGVAAVLAGTSLGGVLEEWLRPVGAVRRAHADALADAPVEARGDLLCELNVRAQLREVAAHAAVRAAWREGRALTLHGWIYGLKDGRLRRLETLTKP